MDLVRELTRSTSQENSIPREPTLPKTKSERRAEFKQRVQAMLTRRDRSRVLQEMLCTADTDLRRIREGSAGRGDLYYSQFVEEFRQLRIKENNAQTDI
jgi:hypothetical protein